MTHEREIIADCKAHTVGEREVVDWTRPDGVYRDVPVMYLQEVTEEEYYEQHPAMRGKLERERKHFWVVSID